MTVNITYAKKKKLIVTLPDKLVVVTIQTLYYKSHCFWKCWSWLLIIKRDLLGQFGK